MSTQPLVRGDDTMPAAPPGYRTVRITDLHMAVAIMADAALMNHEVGRDDLFAMYMKHVRSLADMLKGGHG